VSSSLRAAEFPARITLPRSVLNLRPLSAHSRRRLDGLALRKLLLFLVLAMPALNAIAQDWWPYFSFSPPHPHFGMGAMEDLSAPSPDESVEAAYDVCMQKAATVLIQI
jgi:hypothetical protein